MTFFAPQPGDPTDACPNCGIHRRHASHSASCGTGWRKPGCFDVEAELAVPCQEPERSALVDGEAQWTVDPPRWRDPLWLLRNNWAQQWKLGPIRFEIEWVPRARNFDFWLCFDFSGGRYDG